MTASIGEPIASRPRSPDFVTRGTGELLRWSWARERLTAERNYWVATVTSRGRPHARPVWGVLLDDLLYLSIGAAGFRTGDATREVSVHVDSATDVVIVDGIATRIGSDSTPREATVSYNRKYDLAPDADWLNFLVAPRVVWGWDEVVETTTKWTFRPPS